jgi:hypothetical protein
VQAWRQAPSEQAALTLARAFFPERSWEGGTEASVEGVPAPRASLRVRLPTVAEGEVELASGAHVFHVRSLDAANMPASRRFRTAAGVHALEADSVWGASRVEEGVVWEDTRTPFLARYEVKVPEGIRAVRDAGGWLEFLEASGTPALRLHYPLARDARGLTRQGKVALRGVEPEPRSHGGLPLYTLRGSTLRVELAMPMDGMQGLSVIALGWSSPGSMSGARRRHTATLLLSGKVLVVGGEDASGAVATAELYDPSSRAWSSTGTLPGAAGARTGHTATLLTDGKVLVAGGMNGTTYLDTFSVYDPGTGTWSTPAVTMGEGRTGHTATLLTSGKVLVAGGKGALGATLATAELYDPEQGTWASTGSLTARSEHTATLLTDGKVLVAGGMNGTGYLNTFSVYDSGVGTWSAPAVTMVAARAGHTATLLPSGKVLVGGGKKCRATMSSVGVY